MATPKTQVRGYSTFNQPAGPLILCTASAFDSILLLFLFTFILGRLHLPPTQSLPVFGIGALSTFLLSALRIKRKTAFKGLTPGLLLWKVQFRNNSLFQRDLVGLPSLLIATLVSTVALGAAFHSMQIAILDYPVWKSQSVELSPPTISPEHLTTSPAEPFFYSISEWPKTFFGNPVFYSVLYEKGPPSRFVGHLSAQLGTNRIRLTIEGPKTPASSSRDQLKACFSGAFSWDCLSLKDRALSRHIREMTEVFGGWPSHWQVRWFTVSQAQPNSAQGIWLSAEGDLFTQDRFILINTNDQHQAIILSRPKIREESPPNLLQENELAFRAVTAVLTKMRVLTHLEEGRDWINHTLEKVRLEQLQGVHDAQDRANALAEIQQLLLSRISVDPASFDSYFHLAGTSFLLAQTLSTQAQGPAIAASIQNLDSARKYAHDLADSGILSTLSQPTNETAPNEPNERNGPNDTPGNVTSPESPEKTQLEQIDQIWKELQKQGRVTKN